MARSGRPMSGNPLAALKHANFRLYWSGQSISLIGTAMQRAGQAWLVLTMKDSPFLLGLVGAVQFIPVLLFSLFAGVVADRVSKRKMTVVTQLLLCLQALCLAVLVFYGRVQYWHVLALAALQGTCMAFDTPIRQSFIHDLVGKRDLMNAIALNSAMDNGARIVGPAIGGLIMDAFGPAMAFLLNGISYLFVVAALLLMRVSESAKSAGRRNFGRDIAEGISFARKTPHIQSTLLLVGLVGIFALNLNVLVPVFAKDVFGLGATGYGVMMSFVGVGALCGALTLASFSHHGPHRRLLYGGAIALGLFEILQFLPGNYAVACAILFFSGWAQITYGATANSSLQVSTPDHLRGRVMSLYAFLDQGSVPAGYLFAGATVGLLGARGGFLACGVTTLLAVGGLLWLGRGQQSTLRNREIRQEA